MLIVDAHLDLAYNALRGRDITRPAVEQPADEDGIASVGLPDLQRGGVGLVCATIFCEPATWKNRAGGYTNAQEAHQLGLDQLDYYEKIERAGLARIVRKRHDLPESNRRDGAGETVPVSMVILLEGADPIRTPDDVKPWVERGLRLVGLAWKQTRFAGGTGAPGPLTSEGVELVRTLDQFGIIHDASHLAEQSFWQLLELSSGPVVASHSNCRAIVPTDRQLSDEMIRAIVQRDGVIGINFYDKFLLPPGELGTRRATLDDVIRHVRHICDLAGNANHVGIGTDMDGGFGRDQIPGEITTSADLPRMAEALAGAGFSSEDVAGILGENWLRVFRRSLPA